MTANGPDAQETARGVEKGRYTLGDEVVLAPCAGQAESLAFVNGQGVLPTSGRKAFSVTVTMNPHS